MTATEELRRMLDERGVEWGNVRNDGSESDYLTEWQFDGIEGRAIATEWSVGQHLTVCITHSMTPEQAIAATLGAGTCCDEGTFNSWRLFTCSHCSVVFQLDAIRDAPSIGRVIPPRFCPNCGRRVVEG